MEDLSYIRRNAETVLQRLSDTASRVGVPVPRLVAVTKSGSDGEVLTLFGTGMIREAAENRVAALLARERLARDAGFSLAWHLIGSLQTNKVRDVIGKTALLQSLDRPALAEELEKRSAREGIVTACLLEINSGREAAKGGVMPEDAERFLSSLPAYPHLSVCGIMTMGPRDPAGARKCFRETKTLFDRMRDAGYFGADSVLSMGMSDTFPAAVEEGANMVRVGRAFFKKPYSIDET